MCVKIVFIFKKCNFYKGLRDLRGRVIKELRPKKATRAKKAKRQKGNWCTSANSCAFSKNGAGLWEDLPRN
jgi:hypothetical protein